MSSLVSLTSGRHSRMAVDAYLDDYWVADDSVQGYKDGLPLNVWELEDLLYGYIAPWDELGMLFSKWDEAGFGEIEMDQFRMAVSDPEFRSSVGQLASQAALGRLEARCRASNKPVTYQEFVDMISSKRRRSFNIALHCDDHDLIYGYSSVGNHRHSKMERERLPSVTAKMAHFLSEEFSPGQDPECRKYYSIQYKCWPPPWFIPLVTVVQVVLFVYHSLMTNSVPDLNGPVPIESLIVFHAHKRHEIWRFIFYALVHAGWWHLVFNLSVQVMIGLPLEMVHGSGRIVCIYLCGVLAGSLATSVFDTEVYLVGASGGVYALLAAHIANVFLNYSQVDCGLCWILVSIFVASCDVSFAIWDRYVRISVSDHPVSYLAHLAGAAAGLTLGFLLLKQFDQKPWCCQASLWWLLLSVYITLMSMAIIWNLFH